MHRSSHHATFPMHRAPVRGVCFALAASCLAGCFDFGFDRATADGAVACEGDACAGGNPLDCDSLDGLVFCDGFEDDALSAWLPTGAPETPAIRVTAPEPVHSGSGAARGKVDGAPGTSALKGVLSSAIDNGTLYFRAYYFIADDESTDDDAIVHFDIADFESETARPNDNSGAISYYALGRTGTQAGAGFYFERYDGTGDNTSYAHDTAGAGLPLNKWFCFRAEVRFDPPQQTVYIKPAGGTESLYMQTSPATGNGGPATFDVPGGYKHLFLPIPYTWSSGSLAPGPATTYVDDVAVGTKAIPCGE
ncbi:MAG: hypothetical protein R3A78_02865 [Polyangiales bacterium]